MKYLQLFERYGRKTFQEWIDDPSKWKGRHYLKTKDSTIKFYKFALVYQIKKEIDNNILNIVEIDCSFGSIKNLEGLEKFKNLKRFFCNWTKLNNLKGIENLKNLEHLECGHTDLKNLDEVKNLPNLKKIYSVGVNFDYPIPIEIFDRCCIEKGHQIAYSSLCEQKFKSYYFQRNFLMKFPERAIDLKPIGYHPAIREEFPQFASIFRGTEWGFFDLEGDSR